MAEETSLMHLVLAFDDPKARGYKLETKPLQDGWVLAVVD